MRKVKHKVLRSGLIFSLLTLLFCSTACVKEAPVTETTEAAVDSLDFVRNMKIGWNLGNTFDAIDCSWLDDELEYESAWVGTKTTQELIKAVKDAGFNTIRIPVSWHNHVSDDGKYTINEAWLDRVNEVVDYCIDLDMYVIINIHHDDSKDFIYPASEYLEQSVNYLTCIWTQLSERFIDYDEKLLFAGMNEPRLVGHKNEWWLDNSAACKDAIDCINKLNQAFVDTVRNTGGNNSTRYLICAGYDASSDGALNSGFSLPDDPVGTNENRIILSVHAYTPYDFALEYPGTDTWSSANKRDMSNMTGFMDKLYSKYISAGIPVIIDEFGARDKNGNISSRVDFAGSYVANARARGITCIWWDNNSFSGNGENFGIIDRKSLEWKYPQIVEAMMKAVE